MPATSETYEISAVARLTGISPHVLRVWERRYDVVEPLRTESKRRRYSKDDIRRLTLIKMLVDNGNSIGSIAGMPTSQLEKRLQEISASVPESHVVLPLVTERKIAVAGTLVRSAVREAVDTDSALSVAGEFADSKELIATLKKGAVDLVVIELSTIFPETIKDIKSVVADSGAGSAVVVYQYGGKEAVDALEENKIKKIRFPATAGELLEAFRSGMKEKASTPAPSESSPKELPVPAPDATEIPERLYSDTELAQVARYSSTVKCECPEHLVGLLSNLSAFEEYSLQCENRDEEDMKLHAYLHRATAQCRSAMEGALSQVLEFEGIELD